ncbi:MAG: MerC domain-containing protein [Bacteroidota bacterium]
MFQKQSKRKYILTKVTMKLNRNVDYSDFMGVAASALCTIHCALSPLLFMTKPAVIQTFGRPAHSHDAWASLDYIFLILSLIAVWYSSEHTANDNLSWVLWGAWSLFAIGLFLEPLELSFGIFLMYIGSILLVITHLENYRHCQHCTIRAVK